MTTDKTPPHIKLDERNHVEKPFLDQLAGLGWEIFDLDNKHRTVFPLKKGNNDGNTAYFDH